MELSCINCIGDASLCCLQYQQGRFRRRSCHSIWHISVHGRNEVIPWWIIIYWPGLSVFSTQKSYFDKIGGGVRRDWIVRCPTLTVAVSYSIKLYALSLSAPLVAPASAPDYSVTSGQNPDCYFNLWHRILTHWICCAEYESADEKQRAMLLDRVS